MKEEEEETKGIDEEEEMDTEAQHIENLETKEGK